MGKVTERAIGFLKLITPRSDGFINREDLYCVFTKISNNFPESESSFNSLIFFLKAKGILSKHNNGRGYKFNKEKLEELKKEFEADKK